jgi:hypothetical protein
MRMGPSDISDWEEFLRGNGCKNIIDYGDWIMCNCIFHKQTEKVRPSMGVHKESGGTNCLSCGYHPWSDICSEFGISDVEFIEGVRESIWDSFRNKVKSKGKKRRFKRYKLPGSLENPLGHKGAKKYLIDSKGFEKELLEQYGVRVCTDRNSLYNDYIIFPIYDSKGILYFDARYAGNKSWNPRWRRPKDCAHWRTYFNFQNVRNHNALVFVEGVADALKLIQFGLPAIPAKNFSQYQVKSLLKSGAEHFFLSYDNDEAGRTRVNKDGKPIHYTAKAQNLLEGCGTPVSVVELPDYANDPGDVKCASDLFELNPILAKFKIKNSTC